MKLEHCYPAKVLPESSKNRDQCLVALRHFIIMQQPRVCGLDFPFGLPRELVREDSWEEFILSFGNRYRSPEEFREACRRDAHGRERRRVTDEERRTPFSPYNLWVYHQMYFGIRDVLASLVRDQLACVLPMQNTSPDKSWIVEVCPASTLKALENEGIDLNYIIRLAGKLSVKGELFEVETERIVIAIECSSRGAGNKSPKCVIANRKAEYSCRDTQPPRNPAILALIFSTLTSLVRPSFYGFCKLE